jgi:hypothetical protein
MNERIECTFAMRIAANNLLHIVIAVADPHASRGARCAVADAPDGGYLSGRAESSSPVPESCTTKELLETEVESVLRHILYGFHRALTWQRHDAKPTKEQRASNLLAT